MRRSSLLLVPALVLACSTGEDVSDSTDGGPTDGGLTTGDASTAATSTTASTGGDPTDGSASATTGEASTTTGDPTTGGGTTSDTSDTSGSTGPICDIGTANCACDQGMCQDGLACENGVCVAGGLVCDTDLGEPDDDEPSAHVMGEITDDDAKTLMADGVISGMTDADWYTYHALDTAFHVAEPTVKVTSSGTLRVCQFLECDEGGAVMTEITCPMGTQSALSGALRPGCCGGATFSISDFNCPGSTDNLKVYVRLDKPLSDECIDYSLTVHN